MTILSPGLNYVAGSLRQSLLPPTVVWVAVLIGLQRTRNEDLLPLFFWSKKGITLVPILAMVLLGVVKGVWISYQQEREMKAMGAIPLKTVPAKWPMKIDLAFKVLSEFRNEYAAQWFADQAELLGTRYNLQIMGDNYIITYEPSDIKRILSTEFNSWQKGKLWEQALQTLFGNGVLNFDGEMWKFHRSMTRPFFSKERMTDTEIIQRGTDLAIAKLRERSINGTPVDIQDLTFRYTMDTASEFLLGISTDTLQDDLPPPCVVLTDGLLGSIKSALENTILRVYIGNEWPLREFFGDEVAKYMKPILALVDPIVDNGIKRYKEGKLGDERKSLLDDLILSTSGDRTIVRDEVLNVLIAGRDPTSHAISSVIYFLATENPSILKTLRQEVLDAVGNDTVPTMEQVKSMTYLKAVINESLRLLPPVPFNQRENKFSTTLNAADGTKYYIPAKTQVCFGTIGMHRRADLWGPDAMQFDPNRWLDERREKYYLADTSIFMPFGAGPRICIGQQLALNVTSYFIVRFLQTFESLEFAKEAYPPNTLPPEHWKTGSGRKPVEKAIPKAHVSTFFNGGLWLKLH